jgi:protein-S-isoprenylcysteine O-methyltransferase Ste14
MKQSRGKSYVILVLAYLIGGCSSLLWLVFLFYGSLNIVMLGLNETFGFALNSCLSLIFFIQHSGMIRRSFRERLSRFIHTDYHGALYTIVSGLVLIGLVVFWQKSEISVIKFQGITRWLFHAVFVFGFIGCQWGTRALGSFYMFGVEPIQNSLRGTSPPPEMPFTVRGPYCWVRHPLYFCCLVMIWSCPDLSADRLLYNTLWTVWILIGSVLEERDLLAGFGEEYRHYQRKVPMLIPYRFRPFSRKA